MDCISEITVIKAMNDVGLNRLDKILRETDYDVSFIIDAMNNKLECNYIKYMGDLLERVKELQKEKRNKINPDYEDWKKDPSKEVYKSLD